jgi:inorganic triphosphatase YgiF
LLSGSDRIGSIVVETLADRDKDLARGIVELKEAIKKHDKRLENSFSTLPTLATDLGPLRKDYKRKENQTTREELASLTDEVSRHKRGWQATAVSWRIRFKLSVIRWVRPDPKAKWTTVLLK